jgi:pimeloyl-ACP methyl ester carboxylesterase
VPRDARSGIYYEISGSGIPLILAPYFVTTDSPYLAAYLDALTDRYRVLIWDPPGEGKGVSMAASELTADRMCSAVLGVADAAGFEKFAWCGYSWGAVLGLQLIGRCDRISALVCGGWPPLGGEYAKLLRGARALAEHPPSEGPFAGFDASPFVTFYASLQGWPEAEAVARITCPRLVLYGAEDASPIGVETVEIAATMRARRSALEQLGWRIREIPEGRHDLVAQPHMVVPILREFLDVSHSQMGD